MRTLWTTRLRSQSTAGRKASSRFAFIACLLSLPAAAAAGELEVTGTVSDPTATVTVNDQPATVEATGRFTAHVPVVEGPNTLTATATNRVNEQQTRTIQVTLDTRPPRRSNGRVNDLPSGVILPAGTTQATLGLTTNEVATCRRSSIPDVRYEDMTLPSFTTSDAGRTHTVVLTGLMPGPLTTYVRCQDAVGNNSPDDYLLSFSVAPVIDSPRILTQPASQTVLLGQRAVFRIIATGVPAPTYQWTRNGVDISGATNAVYRIKRTTLADHTAVFRCRVSNSGGSVTSDPATLTVNRYNFVVILTDDQRWDTLTMAIGDRQVMPHANALLVSQGVNFTNAFVTDPLCCPYRASLLSGGFYPQHTGVLGNGLPNGGATKFNDTVTLPTLLQQAGYRTALIGKYLNQYNAMLPRSADGFTTYVPPGWTTFIGKENSNNWFNYTVTIGTSGQTSAIGRNEKHTQYLTDYLKDQATAFITRSGQEPFFLYFVPEAPHAPATPAPEDATLFNDYVYRGRGYDQQALTEDPAWVERVDQFNRKQLRSLQAVDRAVKAVVEQVQAAGVADRTVFIFTSDNGFLWGEHRLTAKWKPNEESIRVPFVVVMPGIAPRSDDHLVVSNLDIGPTLFALADIDKATDGRNLMPLLQDAATPWRDDLLIEDWFDLWAGLRTKKGDEEWKYVERSNGDTELYNLVTDPYELTNLAGPAYQTHLDQFAERLRPLKGLAILPGSAPPKGTVGKAHTYQLRAWGGAPPYTWRITKGTLPDGLLLDATTGLISGIPRTVQTASVTIEVEDQTDPAVTQMNKHQTFVRTLDLSIEPKSQNALDQLRDVQWRYRTLVRPTDITAPPASAIGARGLRVADTVYSPSVVEFNGKHLMLFGVGVFCLPTGSNGETPVYRDTIALIESPDGGNTWPVHGVRYLLEPARDTCFKPTYEWPDGLVNQVNDPVPFVLDSNPDVLWVLYSTSTWYTQINPAMGLGTVGIAAFDRTYTLLYQDNDYLRPADRLTYCGNEPAGYSRPAIRWTTSPRRAELWFDANGCIKRVPFRLPSSFNVAEPLKNPPMRPRIDLIQDELPGGGQVYGGGDLDFPEVKAEAPTLGDDTVFMLQTGSPGLSGRTKSGAVWSDPFQITQPSGQPWDTCLLSSNPARPPPCAHGTPFFVLDRKTCTPKIYFAGFNKDFHATIAVALPSPERVFDFPVCEAQP